MVGRTAIVEISTFSHGPHEHRDPAVEVFNQPEIIFTLEDRWGIHTGRGDQVVHPGVVLLANKDEPYCCRHFEAVPRDRTLSVAFPGLARAGGDSLSDWMRRQEQPPFDSLTVPLTPDLRWYLRALIRETTDRVPGYRLKLDSLCTCSAGGRRTPARQRR